MSRPPLFTLCCLATLLGASGSIARAEPVLLSAELGGAAALGPPQTERFLPGGSVAAGFRYPVVPQLLVGLRVRALMLLDRQGNDEARFDNPGRGTLETLSLSLRLRPLASADERRRGTGLFIEGAAGGGFTGDLTRGVFGAALGWGIPVGAIVVSPVVRYLHVLQPDQGTLSPDDAQLGLLGVELTFGDALPPPPVVPVEEAEPPPPPDRDGDGIPDEDDVCPDDPEDLDGFEDENGCPDPDNDADEILDADDECPDEPEDVDEFADDDGCPDPDNDNDGFADADDQCPNEAETVNGNKDFDGCPDEGLIQMIDDRIVLEERVLFDLERARVKRAARPVLRAIVNLVAQHPEWVRIRIEGHADVRGEEEYNRALSQRRADRVKESLIELGLPPGPMESVGFGSSRPRDKRDVEEAHARNRRVEFVVVARRKVAADGTVVDETTKGAGPNPEEGDVQ